MTILIDIDNTFWNYCEVLLDKLNKLHNTNYVLDDIDSWNWLPDHFDDAFGPTYNDPTFWNDVKPYPYAVEVIKRLSQNCRILFVTASEIVPGLDRKINHLINYFDGTITTHDIIITKHKELIKGNILIDDGPQYLTSAYNTGIFTVKYVQPWNKNLVISHREVYDWLDVPFIVGELRRA